MESIENIGFANGAMLMNASGEVLESCSEAELKEILEGIDDIDISAIKGSALEEAIEGSEEIILYGSEDIAKYQYNMIENPEPLADIADNPAKNFYGGRYNVEVLTEDRIYYRGGNSQNPLGQWFTTEAPESVAKVRIDTAVKPQWIDPATGELLGESTVDTVYTIKIPKGTTVYTGPVGPQGGVYCGGYDIMQTYIETPWKVDGVEVISAYTLK